MLETGKMRMTQDLVYADNATTASEIFDSHQFCQYCSIMQANTSAQFCLTSSAQNGHCINSHIQTFVLLNYALRQSTDYKIQLPVTGCQ